MTSEASIRPAATSLRRHPSATRRLISAELRLLIRDPLTLTFVLAFPVVAMLIIGGAFGSQPDEVFPVNPSHWYVASYFSTVIGATGFIMLPVHIASYRERGVLRRLAAAGFPRWSFPLVMLVLGLVAVGIAGAMLLIVAAPVYGVPVVHDLPRVVLGESLSEVRAVVGLMRESGTTVSLPDAGSLCSLIDDFRRAGTDVRWEVDGDPSRLSATEGLTVYRILQESLTNAVRHSAGASIVARLEVSDTSSRLQVESDGEPTAPAIEGGGLAGMRARAEALGGSLTAGPSGTGWRVETVLPV